MMIETVAVAVAVAVVVGSVVLAVDLSSVSIWTLLKWPDPLHRDLTRAFGGSRSGRGLRRSDEPDRPRVVATGSALEAEQKRLADLKAEVRKLTAAQRERTDAAEELAKQKAALARRERILERSPADVERSAAEATARIEAREAVLATQEAELQQQESELTDRHRSPEEGLGAVESAWWEKQLGGPLSAKE